MHRSSFPLSRYIFFLSIERCRVDPCTLRFCHLQIRIKADFPFQQFGRFSNSFARLFLFFRVLPPFSIRFFFLEENTLSSYEGFFEDSSPPPLNAFQWPSIICIFSISAGFDWMTHCFADLSMILQSPYHNFFLGGVHAKFLCISPFSVA